VNSSKVTKRGLEGARPGREALPGAKRPSRRADTGGRRGLPVLNKPVWEAREIAGYLFLGGLAGASSLVALGAQVTGRPGLARAAKAGAAGAAALSLAALVKDLGRPGRFLNMLRVFKPTSPMSVGTWILSGYASAATAAAASDLTGIWPAAGRAATGVSATLGPAVASYTAVLIADTAVPAWHDAHREMPFLFVSSAATAAAGLGLICAADSEATPVRRLAVLGATGELAAETLLELRLEPVVRRAYEEGRAGTLLRASKVLSAAGGWPRPWAEGSVRSGWPPARPCWPPRRAPGSASSMPASRPPRTPPPPSSRSAPARHGQPDREDGHCPVGRRGGGCCGSRCPTTPGRVAAPPALTSSPPRNRSGSGWTAPRWP